MKKVKFCLLAIALSLCSLIPEKSFAQDIDWEIDDTECPFCDPSGETRIDNLGYISPTEIGGLVWNQNVFTVRFKITKNQHGSWANTSVKLSPDPNHVGIPIKIQNVEYNSSSNFNGITYTISYTIVHNSPHWGQPGFSSSHVAQFTVDVPTLKITNKNF
ncbi:hypothetical protein [Sphingobacterium faecium]|uniref:hypothetical protein n=1 Tax=Sphingobacterium faecium TaxID=34087 RepID=UPI003207BDC9